MARISPPDGATQFFGLYGLSGSITAFMAPLLVATTTPVVGITAMGVCFSFCLDPVWRTHAVLG